MDIVRSARSSRKEISRFLFSSQSASGMARRLCVNVRRLTSLNSDAVAARPETVEGNPAVGVMHVMYADVCRHPAKDRWQIIMRTTMHSGLHCAPLCGAFPIDAVELVLDIEQPHADRGCQPHRRKVNEQQALPASQPPGEADEQRDHGVCAHGAEPWTKPFMHQPHWKALQQKEDVERAEHEKNDWVAIEPIEKPAPRALGAIFLDGERRQRTEPAPVEVAGGRMMDGVRSSPAVVRRHCDRADESSNPVVGRRTLEKRAVAAIVLDHEEPHNETRRRPSPR